ncbi:MAG: tetratricopeptide repeat protein [Prevotellaceae bacterium]|nr:tetratricopeptide repeat protein [Prevotellaceae bacterium]
MKGLGKNIIIVLFLIIASQAFGQYDKYYYLRHGWDYLRDGKYSHAISDFNILIQADTTLYDGYFFRGIAKYNLTDYIGALQDFNKALLLNPVYTQAYHYRAITLTQLNRFDDAMKDYEAAIALRPEYYGVNYSRGLTRLMSQKFDEAIADFNSYLKREPHSSEAYVNRGTAYLLKHDTVKAMDDYNRALYFNVFDPNPYIRRARIYALQNDNRRALKDLDQAVLLDSVSSFIFFNRALVKYNMQDIYGALKDLSKVIEIDPNNALSYYNRALIRSQIGDYNNALSDYDQVMQINPENVLVYFNRAAVEIEIKDYRAALNDYNKAIELYPDFATAYMNRSYVKNQLGHYESARQDYNTAQQKIAIYRKDTSDSAFSIFADTSKVFNKLLALDADFAKKTFNNKLENKRIVYMLQPQFKFTEGAPASELALDKQYFFPLTDSFLKKEGLETVNLANRNIELDGYETNKLDSISEILTTAASDRDKALGFFIKGMAQGQIKQYSSAINYYNKAIELDPQNIFYYLNRSVSQSEMIEFISNMESSMPKLSVDNNLVGTGSVSTRQTYNYKDAFDDLDKLAALNSDFAYMHYNRGNLLCLSNKMTEAIDAYTVAIKQYPHFAEAYFNRGLVSIYLRDTEKGCIDISKSGELGVSDAYSVIKKYCLNEDE